MKDISSVISIPAIVLLLFTIIERHRFASGKETFTDKCIAYLKRIHNLTAPKNEGDVEEYYLTDNVKIVKLFVNDQIGSQNQVENIKGGDE